MTRHDESLPITEQENRLVVTLLTSDELDTVDETLVPISAEKGIQARMGTDPDGTKRLAELHFLTGQDWTREAVASFLADNGLDAATQDADLWFERSSIDADEARVEETEDWWIIRDNVVTQNGVYDGLHRPPDVMEDNWRLYDGTPVTHGHPTSIVQSLDEVAGKTVNTRLDRVTGDDTHPSIVEVRVIADYKLAKHTDVDGLRTTDALVEQNRDTVQRLRDGDGVDNSQGYVLQARRDAGSLEGEAYEQVAEEWIPNHIALLLDREGACTWEDGCGVARLALDCALGTRFQDGTCFPSPPDPPTDGGGPGHPRSATPTTPGDPLMSCDGDCEAATRLDHLEDEVQRARAALDRQGERLDIELDAELDLGAAADKVATHTEPALDRLADYREAEQERKEELAEACADHRLELDDEADRDELVTFYLDKFGSVDALEEHASAIGALATLDEADTSADPSSLRAASQHDHDDEASSGPGVPDKAMWEA
jgi:hypothetical protein